MFLVSCRIAFWCSGIFVISSFLIFTTDGIYQIVNNYTPTFLKC